MAFKNEPIGDLGRRSYTVQRPQANVEPSVSDVTSSFLLTVGAEGQVEYPYWTTQRDNWLSSFWKQHSNDILAGAVSTLVAKIASADFFLEGPMDRAKMYMNILLNQSEWGAGWSVMLSKWVQAYLTRDAGGVVERMRARRGDHTGPALGFAHLNERHIQYTQDREYPIVYNRRDGEKVKVHRSSIMRIVDMPSEYKRGMDIGFCGASRALSTAEILMKLVKYKNQKLSDLPPAGLLFINNLTEQQWQDTLKKYDAREYNRENTVWRNLMTVLGLDPEYPITADMFEFSQIWEGFDEQVMTEIAVFTFALAFRVDPREYWPVSAGTLGTATEARIQHLKAKSKGPGIIFSEIERQMNNPLTLPEDIVFKFDYRDADEDLQAAEINQKKIENIRRMWESSPNRSAVVEGAVNEGMISTEVAQQLLVREGLLPSDLIEGYETQDERISSSRSFHRPYARVYSDGRVKVLHA